MTVQVEYSQRRSNRKRRNFIVPFHLNLQNESVAKECSTDPLIVSPGTTVEDVFQAMKRERRGSVTIIDNDVLLGIFTERDALRLMASGADLSVAIETVMSKEPVTVKADDSVETAIKLMSKGGHRRLLIVDQDDKTVGLVKVTDILHYLVQHFPEFIYNLPPTPNQTSSKREGA